MAACSSDRVEAGGNAAKRRRGKRAAAPGVEAGAEERLSAGLAALGAKLRDRDWRLRNLYWITDKSGARVRFEPNWAQVALFDTLTHRNVDLKVRQLGVTTGYCVLWLDAILFNRGLRVGIVAHTKDDAAIIFRDRIKFAYDQLPAELRAAVRPVKCNTHELLLDNDSGIRVGVTFRSGTVQVLHVTEYGYICQRHPQRADEIRTGAFQAVPADGIIVVESTAKGRMGHFHTLCQEAQKGGGWRFTFLPWWREPAYAVQGGQQLEYAQEREYLERLEAQIDMALTPQQRQWWCLKHRELGDDMFAEYPSTPEEAFKASTEGAYYGALMLEAWQEGRVTQVPIDKSLLVDTWWDLGMNDQTLEVLPWLKQSYQNKRARDRAWKAVGDFMLGMVRKNLDSVSGKLIFIAAGLWMSWKGVPWTEALRGLAKVIG